MSPILITCPNCNHQFEPGDALRIEVEKELRSKMIDWQKQKEQQMELQLVNDRKLLQQSLEESIKKTIVSDFENKLMLLERNNKDNEEN